MRALRLTGTCVVAGLLAMLAVVACSPSVPPSVEKTGVPVVVSEDVYRIDGTHVHDTVLKDGTRCIWQYNGGMDCRFPGQE